MKKIIKVKNHNESMWIDWLLVILYFAIVIILAVSIYLRSDFLIEYGLPGALIISVSAIFFNYLHKIVHMRPDHEGKKDNEYVD